MSATPARGRLAGWTALLFLGLISLATHANPSPRAPLALRWDILEHRMKGVDGESRATLTIENRGAEPLPRAGWAIYFTCLAEVKPGDVGNHLRLDSLGGTYYRLVPDAGFEGVVAGGSVQAIIEHPGIVIGDSLAPAGPYLVRDSAPDVGLPLEATEIGARVRAEQLPVLGPGRHAASAAETYSANDEVRDLPVADLPPVFPSPVRAERGVGELVLQHRPRVRAGRDLAVATRYAATLLDRAFGAGPSGAGPALTLEVWRPARTKSPEAYELRVGPDGIRVRGASPAGVLRGLASLAWLLPPAPDTGPVHVPVWTITDEPRFAYRGFQLDVARNFEPPGVVRRTIDLMARLKLNTLHLHLSDDEGWRLEIAGLPELTEVGGRRGHAAVPDRAYLPPAHGSGPDIGDPFGSGHYSAVEFADLLRYAAGRGIDVVPEFDMPGHSRAAIKAMDARAQHRAAAGDADARRYLLSDPHDESRYVSAQGYADNVLNPALDATYAFIDKVFDGLAAIYRQAGVPLRVVHVGGDELPIGVWEHSPACTEFRAARHLGSVDALRTYFQERVLAIAERHGTTLAGWEQVGLRKSTAPGASADAVEPDPAFARRGMTVYVWDNRGANGDLGYRLANAGYRTVLTPLSHLYLDIAHEDRAEEPGHNWTASISLERVYDYLLFDDAGPAPLGRAPGAGGTALTAQGRARIAGIEAQLFSETVRGVERLDYLTMPRLLAVAERAWTPDPDWVRSGDSADALARHARSWSIFVNQVAKQVLPRLDAEHSGIHYRIPPPGLRVEEGRVLANHAYPGFRLRYTIDGSTPTPTSALVVGPIEAHGRVAVAAFAADGRSGRSAHVDLP